jgi:hypothetical protein
MKIAEEFPLEGIFQSIGCNEGGAVRDLLQAFIHGPQNER